MLGHKLPEDDLIEAVRSRITEGKSSDALDELNRVAPEGWEVVIMDYEPLPLCYSWLFGALSPDTNEEVFVVFRRQVKRPSERRPERRPERKPDREPVHQDNQNSYW